MVKIGTGTGVKRGLEKRLVHKKKIRKILKTVMAPFSEITGKPVQELDRQLLEKIQINTSLAIDQDENIHGRGGGTSMVEPDEPDWEDHYEAPEMDTEIETGEGEDLYPLQIEPSESFFQYAWRCLEQNLDLEEDKDLLDNISNLLNEWEHGQPDCENFPEELLPWFSEIFLDFPYHDNRLDEYRRPEIIFFRDGENISYEIDLGLFERLRFANDYDENARIELDENSYFLRNKLPKILGLQREQYSILAEFLIKNQRPSLIASDLQTAMDRLLSLSQKHDLIPYVTDHGLKRDKAWASRLIKNKHVQVPFSSDPLPLAFFFDEHIGPLNVLKKAIEIHVIRDEKPALPASFQSVILEVLCGKSVQPQTVRKTYWPRLQKIFPEREWEKLGIRSKPGRLGKNSFSQDELTTLINEIGHELQWLERPFEVEEIAGLTKKKGNNR